MRSLLALALVALPGAADPCTADAMLVVDGSASMAEIGLDAGPVPRIVEARAVSPAPVLGIGQCAFLSCLARGRRFSVVTTLAVSVPVIEANLARSGLAAGCVRVRASGVPVLELERAGSGAEARVEAEIRTAIEEDGSTAIVLGCAGMADMAARLEARIGLPVIDGVTAATRVAGLVT
mgnify:CR=1 FL=1